MILAISKYKGLPSNPILLLDVSIMTVITQLDIKLSLVELNKYFDNTNSSFRLNGNDIQMIKNKGFTVVSHDKLNGYWILFDIENENLKDFKRDFKISQLIN